MIEKGKWGWRDPYEGIVRLSLLMKMRPERIMRLPRGQRKSSWGIAVVLRRVSRRAFQTG